MQTFDPLQQQPLHLLPDAVKRLQFLLSQQPEPSPAFRVYVTGGGCSGFQYGFKFDIDQLDEDTSFEQDGIRLLVDSLSIQYLEGSHIHFEENLVGSRFSVVNPNATTQCSCGSSFSI